MLYNFQESTVSRALADIAAGRAALIVSPTGSGKTHMAAEVAKRGRFKRIVFVAHRRELIRQAREKMGSCVAALSLHDALRYDPDEVDLLIIDEAHRSAAKTYRRIMDRFGSASRLGLTATPIRVDGQGLCDAFDVIVESADMTELIAVGRLVPYRAFEAPDAVLASLPQIRKTHGDYATGELARLMDQPRLVGDVVREYKQHALGRKAIVFAVSIAHSRHLAEEFVRQGVRARHLAGNTAYVERDAALKGLVDGEIDVLCNVGLFTEGWDCPSVSCVVMARPTCSLSLYLQSVGRGMRSMEGKRDLIILDHAGNIAVHGYPDDKREWRLVSPRQQRKLEASANEALVRLAGFESVEARLEEKRRVVSETYSTAECEALLGTFDANWARRRGITPLICGRGRRYLRSEIDRLAETATVADCVALFRMSARHVRKLLKRRGIEPTVIGARPVRYSKAEIDALVVERAGHYGKRFPREIVPRSGPPCRRDACG